jgi:ADP-ribose pyrophosphatase YjhB (NUDIX family)
MTLNEDYKRQIELARKVYFPTDTEGHRELEIASISENATELAQLVLKIHEQTVNGLLSGTSWSRAQDAAQEIDTPRESAPPQVVVVKNTKKDDDEKRAAGAKEYDIAEIFVKVHGPTGETTHQVKMKAYYPLSNVEAELLFAAFENHIDDMSFTKKLIFRLTRISDPSDGALMSPSAFLRATQKRKMESVATDGPSGGDIAQEIHSKNDSSARDAAQEIQTPRESSPRAASVSFIEREDGRLLCVWNKRYGGWSLPGGMVEEGETVDAAQARELREETSLETLTRKHLRWATCGEADSRSVSIFDGDVSGAGSSYQPTFVVDGGTADPPRPSVEGRGSYVYVFRVTTSGIAREVEPGSPVTWLTREEFLKWSPFAKHYEAFLKAPPQVEARVEIAPLQVVVDKEKRRRLREFAEKTTPNSWPSARDDSCHWRWIKNKDGS